MLWVFAEPQGAAERMVNRNNTAIGTSLLCRDHVVEHIPVWQECSAFYIQLVEDVPFEVLIKLHAGNTLDGLACPVDVDL